MKIAINCAFFQPQGGGIKEYIQNLVENISVIDEENEYILYVLKDQLEFAKKNLKTNFRIKEIPYLSYGLKNKIIRSLLEDKFWRKEEKIEKWEIFHSPFFHGPKLKSTQLVITVHDMRFFRFPSTYILPRFLYLRHAVPASIKRAAKVISISQFTKDEICEAYNTNPNKIEVIHEAINPNHFTNTRLRDNDIKNAKHLKDCQYLLSVGHLEPRKNYPMLINSFIELKQNHSEFKDLKLAIVGKLGHDYKSTLKLIDNYPRDVLYFNFVSQEFLSWLYANASLFVFPSIYEGFGFPPLEAAIHGVPSAVSNISSIPEICADGAFYFDPYSQESIISALHVALSDKKKRQEVIEAAVKQLHSFSWSQNAKETIELYRKIRNI